MLAIVAANDVGRALNPLGLQGQVEGGISMGLGLALQERFVRAWVNAVRSRDSSIPVAGFSQEVIALFPVALRTAIDHLCDRITAILPPAPHGLDLELVADATDNI